MKNKKMSLGAAFLGALLAGLLVGEVAAKTAGWLYGRTVRVAANEGQAGTPDVTLGDGDAYIQDSLEVDGAVRFDGAFTQSGQNYNVVPATQTVAATETIAADACGGLKRIMSADDVTTGTTNTFTAPSSSNAGCRMLVVNVGTKWIYLDGNTAFPLTSAASLPLGPHGSVTVVSDGTYWRHTSFTEY